MRIKCFEIIKYNKNINLVDKIFYIYMILFSLDDKKIPSKLIKTHGP